VGYTDTHLFSVVAYDSAGNETKTEPVRIQVVHKEEEEKEGEDAADQSQMQNYFQVA
jgi:hypothetical protein